MPDEPVTPPTPEPHPLDIRKFDPPPAAPDSRDHPFTPKVNRPAALPPAFALPELPIRDQQDRGSCGAHGSLRILEGEYQRRGLAFDFSEELQYAETRRRMGTLCQDSGSDVRSALAALVECGAALETSYPYKGRDLCWDPTFDQEASAAAHRAAEYVKADGSDESIKEMLLAGYRVSLVHAVYSNYYPDSTGLIAMPAGVIRGWHWQTIEGWDDYLRRWKVANQWGAGWGDRGYNYFSYGHANLPADQGGFDRTNLWTLHLANEPQPQPQPDPEPIPDPTPNPIPDPLPPSDRYEEGLRDGWNRRGDRACAALYDLKTMYAYEAAKIAAASHFGNRTNTFISYSYAVNVEQQAIETIQAETL